MPRKLRAAKLPRWVDRYKLAHLFSLELPLIAGEGYRRSEDGRSVADDNAIRAAWQRLDADLVLLWINGWAPSVRFLMPEAKEPGVPGTRPAGWWHYCAPAPRRRREKRLPASPRTSAAGRGGADRTPFAPHCHGPRFDGGADGSRENERPRAARADRRIADERSKSCAPKVLRLAEDAPPPTDTDTPADFLECNTDRRGRCRKRFDLRRI